MIRKSFLEIFNETQNLAVAETPAIDEQEFGFVDNHDAEILMHRDAHFGGQFALMLEHYHCENRGAHPDISMERIEYLARCEMQMKENLAASILTGPQAERVGRAKDAYKKLREIYELDSKTNLQPRLIADLILSEEEEPEDEIYEIVEQGESMVEALVHLLRSETFQDPLFPGYGLAPELAAHCLGEIGSAKAVVPLFECVERCDVDLEEQILIALHKIGSPAQEFLLKILHNEPITPDNERAALILNSFTPNETIARACLGLLGQADFISHPSLCPYLVLGCQGLESVDDRAAFATLASSEAFPAELREDARLIQREWETAS